MRKIVSIAIVILFGTVGTYVIYGKLIKNNIEDFPSVSNTVTVGEKTELTEAEIAKHNTEADCWMIIEDKVYNLSNYSGMHPAGPEKVLKYCGKVGTEGWKTKDKPLARLHSQMAQVLLDKFYIGKLNENVAEEKTVTEANSEMEIENIEKSIVMSYPEAIIKEVKKSATGYTGLIVLEGKEYSLSLDKDGKILSKEEK